MKHDYIGLFLSRTMSGTYAVGSRTSGAKQLYVGHSEGHCGWKMRRFTVKKTTQGFVKKAGVKGFK